MALALEDDQTESDTEEMDELSSELLDMYSQQPVHFRHECFQEKIGSHTWDGLSIEVFASDHKETLVGKQHLYYGVLDTYAVLVIFSTVDPSDHEIMLQAWSNSTFTNVQS